MPDPTAFPTIFNRLKTILTPYAANMVVTEDSDHSYYLNTQHIMKNKKPLFFAAVRIGKAYVSFHLMPVYAFPDLMKNVSPGLRKRMQGKSCFNFTHLDEPLFQELEALTQASVTRYKTQDFI
jgi:hypothetical protein